MPSCALTIGPHIVISRWPARCGEEGGQRVNPNLLPSSLFLILWVAKTEREEACWDETRSRRHVVHVCCKRRAKMVGSLMGKVQSKVSQILNKSKKAWKAFCLLKALSSRVTDQAQVEAEDWRFGHMGRMWRAQLWLHSQVSMCWTFLCELEKQRGLLSQHSPSRFI